MFGDARLRLPDGAKVSARRRAVGIAAFVADWLRKVPIDVLCAIVVSESAGRVDHEALRETAQLSRRDANALLDVVGREPVSTSLLAPRRKLIDSTAVVEALAARHFDFRGQVSGSYRERWEVREGIVGTRASADVYDNVVPLGLVGPQSVNFGSYDATLVLGGGARAPLLRTAYARHLRDRQGVELGEIGLLGSARPVGEWESQFVSMYAPNAVDEFDLLLAAAQEIFVWECGETQMVCGCASTTVLCQSTMIRGREVWPGPAEYTHERAAVMRDSEGVRRATAVSARSGRAPYRANTADTYRCWCALRKPQAGMQILIVTTQVYAPFQLFDALRLVYLPLGVNVDVAGYGEEQADRPLTAEALLQEVLSAVRSARRCLWLAYEYVASV
jgi:hypothetical protein